MHTSEQTAKGVASANEDQSDFQLGYSPALDGLRGISILAVLAFNGHLVWMRGGFIGVDIFFVLSGFLITVLLVQNYHRTSEIGLKNFYFRRALRLLPALLALMLVSTAFVLLFQSPEKIVTTIKGELYTLFYVANWAQAPPRSPGIGPMSHAWSLSVEEQFYIIWPVLLFVLLKMKSKRVVLFILLSLVVISILLNVWFWQTGVPYLRMYFGSDTRANEILIGCIAALLISWGVFQRVEGSKWAGHLKWAFHSTAILSLSGILLSFFLVRHNQGFVYNGGFALISVGVALVILDLVLFPSATSRIFEFALLVWIGRISYGIYLWHFPIFEASRQLFEGRTSVIFYQIFGLIATFLVAAASFYLLEQPFLKLRRRFGTSRPESDLFPVSTRTAPSV